MKGGKEHRVPLSPAAIALLKALPTESGNGNLFIGARGDRTSQAAVTVLPKRLGYDVTVHGFRSTFSDWAHERTGANDHPGRNGARTLCRLGCRAQLSAHRSVRKARES